MGTNEWLAVFVAVVWAAIVIAVVSDVTRRRSAKKRHPSGR